MTALINASTSSGVVVTSDTSGSLAFQSNGTTIMTVASTGVSTQVGAPCFSAVCDGTQSISSSTYVKILFATEAFDTNNNFASSTFTPTVAGYYQLNSYVNTQTGSGTGESLVVLYKNGSAYRRGTDTKSDNYGKGVNAIVYANGTTDYFEIYFYQGSGSTLTANNVCYFDGAMIRSA